MKSPRILSLFAAILVLIVSSPSSAQVPSLAAVTLNASVVQVNGVLRYSYTVTNSAGNTGSVSNIKVDISIPNGSSLLSGSGLDSGGGFMSANSSAIIAEQTTLPMVPVGAYSPTGWVATVTTDGSLLFAADDETAIVASGRNISGFQITTYGLPTIRQFRAEPYLDFDSLPLAQPTPETLPAYFAALKGLLASASCTGLTIGPTAPPANFQPIPFLQIIQSYKERSVQQGWIADSGVAISLDAKLNAAQRALQNGDSGTAKNVLNALINEVQAQANKHLTPEAVALLQFNSQYLVSQLP
jgi:hypothetical protein